MMKASLILPFVFFLGRFSESSKRDSPDLILCFMALSSCHRRSIVRVTGPTNHFDLQFKRIRRKPTNAGLLNDRNTPESSLPRRGPPPFGLAQKPKSILEAVNKSMERKDFFANINLTNAKPVALALRAVWNIPGNLLAEAGKIGNISGVRGIQEHRTNFEPFAALKRVHIPGSNSFGHFLSSTTSANFSFPKMSFPPRAIVLNWTAQPIRNLQSVVENWRRQGAIASQRRGKVIVRSSRDLAALLEQVRFSSVIPL